MVAIDKGRIVGGKYRLEEPIAGGGMGSIWRGWDLRLDAPVAVKFMLKELAEKDPQRVRFEREAKAAAKIRSPHVVHMYDHGIDEGTPYIVMELLEGEDLGQRLKRVRQLPVPEVVRICTEICRGLHRAHRRHIIHRDLKPRNIFLSAPDDDLVKILDFGIAKAHGVRLVGPELTTTGQLLGSPHYMSPEQARGMALDGRSDLWSLAVILYRALTGYHPFRGVDVGDLIVRICMDPIQPPTRYRPGLGPDVDQFFERAFSREPGGRHQSAKEFAEAFETAAKTAAPAVEADAVGESSWDSSGASRPAVGRTPAPWSDSGVGSPASGVVPLSPAEGVPDAPAVVPAAAPAGVQALRGMEPTPTEASRTLGTLPDALRPPRPWAVLVVVAGLLLMGGGVGLYALLGSSAESSTAEAGSGEGGAATTATATHVSGAAGLGGSPPAEEAAATASATASAEATTEPSASATARPVTRPAKPRPRPTAARPRPTKPKPKPSSTKKTPAPYQASDLGY